MNKYLIKAVGAPLIVILFLVSGCPSSEINSSGLGGNDSGTHGVDRNGFDAEGYFYKNGKYNTYSKFDDNGFDKKGYDLNGFDRNGNHVDTHTKFDSKGRDKDGFDVNGFSRYGMHRNGTLRDNDGYDQDGYDRNNFDRAGFNKRTKTKFDYFDRDKDGRDKEGFDSAGYNRDGFNRQGFDKNGFNKDGLNRFSFDRTGHFHRKGQNTYSQFDDEGFDKDGINSAGFDRTGFFFKNGQQTYSFFDDEGFDSKGYNENHFDRNGFHRYTKTRFDFKGYFYRNGQKTDSKYDDEGYDWLGYDRNGRKKGERNQHSSSGHSNSNQTAYEKLTKFINASEEAAKNSWTSDAEKKQIVSQAKSYLFSIGKWFGINTDNSKNVFLYVMRNFHPDKCSSSDLLELTKDKGFSGSTLENRCNEVTQIVKELHALTKIK